MADITIKIEKDKLIITAPIPKKLTPSKSGKSLVVASTHGNVATDVLIEGKPVMLGLNAYIKS